jgi:hypothetical protein
VNRGLSKRIPKSITKSLFGQKNNLNDRDIFYSRLTDEEASKIAMNSQTKRWFTHRVCGTEWEARPANVCGKQQQGCPKCGKLNVCENLVREALRGMALGDGVVVVGVDDSDWSPEDCVYGHRYRFDIRVHVSIDGATEPVRFFLIEVDGPQHFEARCFDGANPTNPDAQRHTDILKMQWAFERDIPVVRVPTAVVSFSSKAREVNWIERVRGVCIPAAKYEQRVSGIKFPLFVYPGTEKLYSRHIDDIGAR